MAEKPARPATGKDEAARHPFGPRPIGALMPGLTRPAFRKQSPAAAQLMADWPTIVGAALAASAYPRRFGAGTLTLGCAGPVALELQHLSGALIERINGHLGRALVHRIRFIQVAPAQAPPTTAVSPAARAKARLAPIEIVGLPDSPLRDALAALGTALRNDPG